MQLVNKVTLRRRTTTKGKMEADCASKKLLFLHVICCLHLIFFTPFAFSASPRLHPQEVRALREIGMRLGKRDWDFSKDPCSGEGNWRLPVPTLNNNRGGVDSSLVAQGDFASSLISPRQGFDSSVRCACSFDRNTTCHVVSIALKGLNFSGGIPPEFAKLRHLKVLDISRNCFNGSVPPQWASMHLQDLSLMGNNLSGPFPKVLTIITTLRNLSIEGNQFSGPLPHEIGRLINLQKLALSSNGFTGELPEALGQLTNLTDMRISDNNFTGKIPEFIGNWTKIMKLQIQGCSLEGPIPSSISLLGSLSDLRISDLKGGKSTFPPLNEYLSMKKLILRNCFIYGEIPEYIGYMTKLQVLDLSYNDLSGEIPKSFVQLVKVDFIYLTRNKLTGPIPPWILSRNNYLDISHNNFTWDASAPAECPRGSVNLVESYALTPRKSVTEDAYFYHGNRVHPCLMQNFPCSFPNDQRHYKLHINCGGKGVQINNDTTYEADLEPRGASTFYSGPNWAFSSTGTFMDNDIDADIYISSNTSALHNITAPLSELYTTARVSPISLTYYGLCLINGHYTVKLHFAEIAFTNDSSFASLGKRIFDVYIQGDLVLKDFNIANEAGGAGKPLVKTFNASVSSHTLKIDFYWAGRGTTGIPIRGVYGPLISAISVDPNFKPPVVHGKRIGATVVVGIVAGAIILAVSILFFMRRKGWLGGKIAADKELRGLDLQTGLFTLRQIKAATKNFDPANKIGEGGFGSVYKGVLFDRTIIAVKQLSSKSKQGTREFVNEIGMISALQHPNLVKLYGCCVEGNQLLLIYEYMENNCLSRALFGRENQSKLNLDWAARHKICLGIAKGLAYLHEESMLKIVHRDIKTSNVLLDKDFNAKISDFGLAKLNEDDNSHISTRVAGTIGYMAPEYAMRGYLTDKADVYSFGVVALEIVSGKSNTNYRPREDFVYLLDWAYVLQERGSLLELVDPDLGSDYSSEEAMLMLNVALLCTNASPTLRPTMSQAVSMLEGQTAVQELLSDPGFSTINSRYKGLRSHFWQNISQTQSVSTNARVTESSSSNVVVEETGHFLRGSYVASETANPVASDR